MSEPAPGNFGSHLARVVGEMVTHALVAILPHHHAERVRAHNEWAQSLAEDLRGGVVPLLQHFLDTDAVHPTIEPVIRKIVEGK